MPKKVAMYLALFVIHYETDLKPMNHKSMFLFKNPKFPKVTPYVPLNLWPIPEPNCPKPRSKPAYRVSTVIESQGKICGHGKSWKVMENNKNIKSHGKVKIVP